MWTVGSLSADGRSPLGQIPQCRHGGSFETGKDCQDIQTSQDIQTGPLGTDGATQSTEYLRVGKDGSGTRSSGPPVKTDMIPGNRSGSREPLGTRTSRCRLTGPIGTRDRGSGPPMHTEGIPETRCGVGFSRVDTRIGLGPKCTPWTQTDRVIESPS